MCRRDDKHQRIDIGHRRADEGIFARQNFGNKAFALLRAAHKHLIAGKRRELFVPESAFGTAIDRRADHLRLVGGGDLHAVQAAGALDDSAADMCFGSDGLLLFKPCGHVVSFPFGRC